MSHLQWFQDALKTAVHRAPKYYVVVNETIKEVCDLLIPEGAAVPDYHTTREGAEHELAEIIRQNPRPTQVAETVPTEAKVDDSTPATQDPPPTTPAAQTRSRSGRRGRPRRPRRQQPRPSTADISTASDTPNESEDESEVCITCLLIN